MRLDELKKSMSTLEQALATTNNGVKADISAAVTAQSKLLRTFRRGIISCLILAVVFAAAVIFDINPVSLPLHIKIYLSSFLALGAVWYIYIYRKLKGIDIAALAPSRLLGETSAIRMLTISGEVFFTGCLIVLFALLLPHEWVYSPTGFWATVVLLAVAVVLGIVHYIPEYNKLLSDLNAVKE